MKCRYLLSLAFSLYIWVCKSNIIDNSIYGYGLTLLAHSTNQDQRTNLDLIPAASLSLPGDGFSVRFDMKLRNELYTYGYAVWVIAGDSSYSDSISYLPYSRSNIILTDKDRMIKNTEIADSVKIVANRWIHVDLQFTRDRIHIAIDGIQAEINHFLSNFKDIKIYLGDSKHPRFFSAGVSPIAIRNMELVDIQGKLLHKWKLAAHGKDVTHDSIRNKQASVRNGIQEMDKHTKRAALASLNMHHINLQVAHDDVSGRFFIAGGGQSFVYGVKADRVDSIAYKGYPYIGASNQTISDTKRNRFLPYASGFNDLNVYESNRKYWTLETPVMIDTRQHHNRIINQKKDELIVFGGYGNHRYNSQLSRINLSDPQGWSISSLDSCPFPRYLSAMGAENEDYLLIMGSCDNQLGKQEESPGNFYDLYRLNLKTGKCTKLWEFVNDGQHFTFGNSMTIDTPSNSVYALACNNDRYDTLVYLNRFDIQTRQPVQEAMSDSVVYNFLDTYSYCDMFLHKETSSIYAVVLQEREPGISKVEFYKLAFPSSSKGDILSHQTGEMKPAILISGILTRLLCLIGGSMQLLHDKRKGEVNVAVGPAATEKAEDKLVEEEPTEQKVSSVLLLGGFQVFDKRGGNIMGDSTPALEQLFLFLLPNTIEDGKGATSQCLDETFWFDMSKSNTSNSGNVNIRKLGLIIEKIGDVNITNKDGYQYLNLGEDVVYGYQEMMRLLDQIKDTIMDRKIINKIISLASVGALLPNVSAEWIDEYKSVYYVLLTEILLSVVNRSDIEEDPRLLLKVSDMILLVDSIGEDTICTKYRVLYQIGQKGLSEQNFDKFCIEHERLLNAKPDFSYGDTTSSL